VEPTTINTLPERELSSTALLTVIIVLAAATMTFGAIIAVFIYRSEGRVPWGKLELPATLFFTTAILLVSSATIERAKRAVQHNDQPAAYRFFLITFTLGAVFLAGQITAWFQVLHSGIELSKNQHSWFIFLFVALHGLHIVLGLAGIGTLAFRTHEYVSGPRYQANTRAMTLGVSIFWHYLDFLWLVLFGFLLFWKR
jgi:cytochrome c oxidase subunit 3